MSALAAVAEDYLRVRRALGYRLERQGRQLHQFVAYLDDAGASTVTIEHAVEWATQPAGADCNYWGDRLSVARQFARYLQTIDPACEVPPTRLLPYRRRRPTPYLYSPQEIVALMTAAGELRGALHRATMQTLIGLMAVTGMRTGEAIGLDRDDVDVRHQLLRVIEGKFGKSREVALHESTMGALDAYAQLRDRVCPRPTCEAFFISRNGTRLFSSCVNLCSLASSGPSVLSRARRAAGRTRTTSGTVSLSARSLAGTPPTRTSRPGCRRCPRTWGTWSRPAPTTT